MYFDDLSTVPCCYIHKLYLVRHYIITCIVLLAAATISVAQSDDYTAHNPGWLVDIDEAYAKSKEEGKPIMANFTGSDWCGWCKRLTASVFSKQEFKDWAEDNVILLELDFPRRTKLPKKYQEQNYSLQQAFKVRNHSTLCRVTSTSRQSLPRRRSNHLFDSDSWPNQPFR